MSGSLRSVLFACGQPIYPAGWGGAETSIHDLLVALAAAGIAVRALGATPQGEASRVRGRLETFFAGRAPGEDGSYRYDVGYACEIVPHEAFAGRLEALFERERPDVVLTQAIAWPQVVELAHARRVPSMLYVHGAEMLRLGMPPAAPDRVLYNSAYTRDWLAGEGFPYTGEILYPPTDLARHRIAAPGPRSALTLVNPLPVKGGHLLPLLARALPDRRFLAVEGWVLPPYLARSLAREPNVAVVPWQHDMRTIYAQTAVLLVPSLFEPFGRAPVEAAASGIPSITSGAGGLREAVGPDGVFADPEGPIEAWVDAVRRLEDDAAYRDQSAKCAAWAGQFDAPVVAKRFAAMAEALVAERRQ